MPNLFSTLENVLRPEEAIRNRKEALNTIGRVIPFAGPLDLPHLWDDYLRGVIGVLGPQFGIQMWQNMVKQFLADLAGETAETILEGMLTFMKVRILLDPFIINGGFRRNLYNFDGKYQFSSQEGGVDVLVKFANTNLDWEETSSPQQVDVTTTFKNGPALTNFLINYVVKNDRDILKGLTKNEIRVKGNLNYLFKFLFMVNHLLLEATGQLPH
jgi:hypothetical protein